MAFDSLPDWYQGEFDDMEYAIKCLLDQYLDGMVPAPTVFAWLPDNWRAKLPIIAIARVPGAIEDSDQEDAGVVQVWAIADSRADAWVIANLVRTVFHAFRKGVLVDVGTHKVNIKSIALAEGPQLSMDDERLSERLIPLSFQVTIRRRASLPDYEKILRSM